MKKHLSFVLIMIFSLLIIDLIGGNLLKNLYFSENANKNDKILRGLNDTKNQLVIFGSSRAIHHHIPAVYEEITGMKAYNLGENGQNIFYHYAILNAVLQRYVPKVVILELLAIDFTKTPEVWNTEKLSSLLPLTYMSDSVKKVVELRGFSEQYKMISNLYRFNSSLYTIIRNNYYPFHNDFDGYIPISGILPKNNTAPKKEIKNTDIQFDPVKIDYLNRFILLCKQKNIQLFITISPSYNSDGGMIYERLFSSSKLVPYGDVINMSFIHGLSDRSENFKDFNHLNHSGAEKFTKIVASRIIKYEN